MSLSAFELMVTYCGFVWWNLCS